VDGKDQNAIFNVSSATASSKRLSAADAREALSLKGGDKVAFSTPEEASALSHN